MNKNSPVLGRIVSRTKAPSGRFERQICTGLIVSTEFIQGIEPIYNESCLKIPFARTVARWALEYFNKYQVAPKHHIEDIFKDQRYSIQDPDEEDMIKSFLSDISKEYVKGEKFNAGYILDKTEAYFREESLKNLTNEIRKVLIGGRIEEAEALVKGYKRVARVQTKGVNPIDDPKIIASALDDNSGDKLFKLPGVLGDTIGTLERGWLFAFVGASGIGKCLYKDSQILLDDGRLKSIEWIIKNKISNSVSINNKLKITSSYISEFYFNGIKPIFEVQTKTGRKIKITSNHPLYEFNKKWISIDDGLKIGNYIGCPKQINIFGDKNLPDEHVRLIAYLLADGGFTGTEITFTKKEQAIKKDVIKIITNLGDCYRVDNELSISINKGKRNYSPEKTKTKKLLLNYNIKLCKSIYKIIPDCIFTLPKKQLREFLKILFTCDGSVFDFGIEYCSGSEKMLRQVSHLLLRFGIIGKVTGKKSNIGKHIYWTFSILDSFYIQKFIENIGFAFSKKKKADLILKKAKAKRNMSMFDSFPATYRKVLIKKIKKSGIKNRIFKTILEGKISNKITRSLLIQANQILQDKNIELLLNADIIFDEIVSIEKIGQEETYDITVPVHHNFIANDICAHNSWWLMLTGLRALFAGLNVVFISMEMSEKQMARRIQHWINGQPTKRWAGELLMPVFDCMKNQEDECNKIKRETGFCTACIGTNEFEFGTNFKKITRKELTIATAIQKSKALRRSALVRGNSFKLVTYPSRTASMDDIYAYLYNLEHYENFIPDVIVTDYADKVKPSDSRMQYRHQIAQVWESHKAMAQERNCLVVTGSQSNTARTGKDIKQGDWSESIAKLELCDAGIALNMSPKDKKAGIMRALVVKQRDDYFDLMQQVAILHQLKIGRPFLNSCLMPMKKDEKKEG